MDDSPFEGEPLIYGYTRRQALDVGVLVDLTDQAQETGFIFPGAYTGTLGLPLYRGVWKDTPE